MSTTVSSKVHDRSAVAIVARQGDMRTQTKAGRGVCGCNEGKKPHSAQEQIKAQIRAYREMLRDGSIANSTDPTVVKQRQEIEQRMSRLTAILANPKGSRGELSAEQRSKVNQILREINKSIKSIRETLKSGQCNPPAGGSSNTTPTDGSSGTPQNPSTGGETPSTGGTDGSSGSGKSSDKSPVPDGKKGDYEKLVKTAKEQMRNGDLPGAIDSTQDMIDMIQKNPAGKDGELSSAQEFEIQKLTRRVQRMQNLMDQLNAMLTNMEKSRHESRMAVVRNLA